MLRSLHATVNDGASAAHAQITRSADEPGWGVQCPAAQRALGQTEGMLLCDGAGEWQRSAVLGLVIPAALRGRQRLIVQEGQQRLVGRAHRVERRAVPASLAPS